MKSILFFLFACLTFGLQTNNLLAQEIQTDPMMGPTLTDYGPTYAIKDRDVQLPEDFVYKAVFDITKTPDSKNKHNRAIESIARLSICIAVTALS